MRRAFSTWMRWFFWSVDELWRRILTFFCIGALILAYGSGVEPVINEHFWLLLLFAAPLTGAMAFYLSITVFWIIGWVINRPRFSRH